jgi:hypothetical protein
MKKEKSIFSVVTTHILTSSIVFPFFGMFVAYFVIKFLSQSLNSNITLILIRDLIHVIFFFIGVQYSLSYIHKKIDVKNPKDSFKYSVIGFGIVVIIMLTLNIYPNFNIIDTIYNTVFYGIIFIIFYILTKKYFNNL